MIWAASIGAVVAYLVCAVLTYGLTFAHFQRVWPTIAEQGRAADRNHALFMAAAGPIGLLVAMSYGKHGLMFKADKGDDDGRYRKTGTSVHSSSGSSADQGAGAGLTVAQVLASGTTLQACRTQQAAFANYRSVTAQITPPSMLMQAKYVAVVQAAQQLQMAGTVTPEPTPADVENTGIQLGEIIAWRAWKVKDGRLYSIINSEFQWRPYEAVEADRVGAPKDHGVHAFKDGQQVWGYTRTTEDKTVIGQVALWGEIYEFEHGWHAEFAKVHSLTAGNIPDAELEVLRQTYGVA